MFIMQWKYIIKKYAKIAMISLLCIMLFSWMDKKNNEFEINMDTQIGLVLDSDDFFYRIFLPMLKKTLNYH